MRRPETLPTTDRPTPARIAHHGLRHLCAVICSGLLFSSLVLALVLGLSQPVSAQPTITSMAQASSNPVYTFNIETVTAAGDVGRHASLADAAGRPMLAYYDAVAGDLMATRFNGTAWEIDVVDTVGDAGTFASLERVNNRPAIAYYAADPAYELRYAFFDGDGWHTGAVDDAAADIGRHASLVDAGSGGAIAYYDATNADLKVAFYNGEALDIQVIDSTGDVGRFASAAPIAGMPSVAYYDATQGDLKYAVFDGTSWSIETVDANGDVGRYAALFDDDGWPAIAYYDAINGDLRAAFKSDSGWRHSVVDSEGDVGQYATAVLVDGRPHIAYYDATNGDLKLAYETDGAWQVQSADTNGDVGQYTSIALIDGRLAIGYYDATNTALKYLTADLRTGYVVAKSASYPEPLPGDVLAYTIVITNPDEVPYTGVTVSDTLPTGLTHVPGSTTIEPAAAGGSAGDPPIIASAMVLAPGGVITVSYSATVDLGLTRATSLLNHAFVSAHQSQLPVTATAVATVANAAPLAHTDFITTARDTPFTVTGSALLANDNDPNDDALTFNLTSPLQFGSLDAAVSWSRQTLDEDGGGISLQQVGGFPAIAYTSWNGVDADLKYARFDGDIWHVETVDTGVKYGESMPSLAAVDGQPAIAYFKSDEFENYLMYTRLDGTAWRTETLMSIGSRYGSPSLLSIDDRPAIAFPGPGNGYQKRDLYFARFDGTQWHGERITQGWDIGGYLSMALIDGQPSIGFVSEGYMDYGHLSLARFDGQAWQTTWVDGAGADVEGQVSLANIGGQPALAFHEKTQGNVKYAVYDGQAWNTQVVDWVWVYCCGIPISLAEISGYPTMVYEDRVDGVLKYARLAASGWKRTIVISEGINSGSVSLLEMGGAPTIGHSANLADENPLTYIELEDTTLHYTPPEEVCGTDSFTYQAGDGELQSALTAVEITVECSLPVAVTSHPAVAAPGEPVTWFVSLENPYPMPYDNVSVAIELVDSLDFITGTATIAPPEVGGTVGEQPIIASGMFIAPGQQATVTFQTTVGFGVPAGVQIRAAVAVDTDSQTLPTESAQYVTVANVVPTASADRITTTQDASLSVPDTDFLSNDVDANLDTLSFHLDSAPLNGALLEQPVWRTASVDPGFAGWYPSLAEIGRRPAVSYYDFLHGALKYARFDGYAWQVETVDDSGDVGFYSSLAEVNGQWPAIAYADMTTHDLKYAYYDGDRWHVEVVDSTHQVGEHVSLTLVNARPAISYYDRTHGALKYAEFDGRLWHIETVDSLGDVGVYSSIVEVDGKPMISYYSATAQQVRVAQFDGDTWSSRSIGSAGLQGGFTSIAIVEGQPAISFVYADWLDTQVRLARFNGTAWQVEYITDTNNVQAATSLAEVDGRPVVSYLDKPFAYHELHYASYDDEAWQIESVQAIGPNGAFSSMAVIGEKPAFAYADWNSGALGYAASGLDLTYVPNAGVCGLDSFAYRAGDGASLSEPVSVRVDILCSE